MLKYLLIFRNIKLMIILDFRTAESHLLSSQYIGQYLCFINSHYVIDNTKACLYHMRMQTGLEAYRCRCGLLFTADTQLQKKKLIFMRKGSWSSSDISLQVFYMKYRILYILQRYPINNIPNAPPYSAPIHSLVSTTIKKMRKNPNLCTRYSAIGQKKK